MEIEFRDVKGCRVGFIIGTDVKNNYGNRVGYISGNEIRTTNGNRAGINNGSYIKDNYGNRVGYINGSEIRDIYGNKVGYPLNIASEIEMAAAALLLFDLSAEETSNTSRRHLPKREKPQGFSGYSGAYIGFLLRNWGGRIGLLLGVVFLIILFVTDSGPVGLNALFIGIIVILILGTIGAVIGGIVNFIRRKI